MIQTMKKTNLKILILSLRLKRKLAIPIRVTESGVKIQQKKVFRTKTVSYFMNYLFTI